MHKQQVKQLFEQFQPLSADCEVCDSAPKRKHLPPRAPGKSGARRSGTQAWKSLLTAHPRTSQGKQVTPRSTFEELD